MGSPESIKPIDVSLVPFNSIEDVRTTGTPPGNRSIWQMLHISSNNNDDNRSDSSNSNNNDKDRNNKDNN